MPHTTSVAKLTNDQINDIINLVRSHWGVQKMCGADTEEMSRVFNACILFGEEIKRLRTLVKGKR